MYETLTVGVSVPGSYACLGAISDTQLCDQIIQSLCNGAAAVLSSQDKILGGVVDAVSASCADVLKKCVGATVGTMFRAGNQGPPTHPSEYVKREQNAMHHQFFISMPLSPPIDLSSQLCQF